METNKNPKYDVLIKSGTKDYVKLPFVIETIKFLNPQPEKIFLINPDGFKPEGTSYDDKLVAVKDEVVFPGCDRQKLNHRPNWCFATFMALFQDVTEQDYYLDIQSDNLFVNPVELFNEEGKPKFFMSPQHSHYHQQYFNYSKSMFNLDRVGSDSFIIDFMMYNKKVSKEILEPYGDFNNLYEKSCEIINGNCYPTEQDLFANWCLKHKPDMYEVVTDVQTKMMGKTWPANYTSKEVEDILKKYKDSDLTAFSIHTWT